MEMTLRSDTLFHFECTYQTKEENNVDGRGKRFSEANALVGVTLDTQPYHVSNAREAKGNPNTNSDSITMVG